MMIGLRSQGSGVRIPLGALPFMQFRSVADRRHRNKRAGSHKVDAHSAAQWMGGEG